MKKTKSLLFFAAAVLLAASCKQELLFDASCQVTLDESNTYRAGEPVIFNFEGNADAVTFFSGENGHQYIYKDRLTVPFEDITALTMTGRIQPRYGQDNSLDIYFSNEYEFNLKGDDGEADRATIRKMYEEGMKGWDLVYSEDDKMNTWHDYSYDISKYASSFAIAYHWHSTSRGQTVTQRSYWIDGAVNVSLKGVDPSSKTLKDIEFISVMMNPERDAYWKNKSNGSVVFNNSAAQLVFQGCAATEFDYDFDVWVFSRPIALNGVSPDKCQVIKNISNKLGPFTYTYAEPGTYTATFVGINETIQGRSEKVKNVRVTITN